jgi:hypothetical protein
LYPLVSTISVVPSGLSAPAIAPFASAFSSGRNPVRMSWNLAPGATSAVMYWPVGKKAGPAGCPPTRAFVRTDADAADAMPNESVSAAASARWPKCENIGPPILKG